MKIIMIHNFWPLVKNLLELLQYRSSHHKNDIPEKALKSYTQINIQNRIDLNI